MPTPQRNKRAVDAEPPAVSSASAAEPKRPNGAGSRSSAVVAPLDRSNATLRAQVRHSVWALIMTGTIETGPLYSVRWLSEQLGVSATPVREALMDLGRDGVVVVHRSRGFSVPTMSEQELDDIAEIRALLEVPTIERLAGKLDPETLQECRELAADFERGVDAGDPIQYLRADQQLHLKLLGASGNPRLVQIIEQLREQTRLYGIQQVAEEGLLAEAAREHTELLDAIESGDRQAVRRHAKRHLRHVRGVWAGRSEEQRSGSTAGTGEKLPSG